MLVSRKSRSKPSCAASNLLPIYSTAPPLVHQPGNPNFTHYPCSLHLASAQPHISDYPARTHVERHHLRPRPTRWRFLRLPNSPPSLALAPAFTSTGPPATTPPASGPASSAVPSPSSSWRSRSERRSATRRIPGYRELILVSNPAANWWREERTVEGW